MNGFYMVSRDFLRKIAADVSLTAGELRIMAAIMAQVKKPGDVIDARIPTLVQATGQDHSSVVRNRRQLVRRGFLVPAGHGAHGVGLFVLADNDARVLTDATGRTDATVLTDEQL